MSVYPLIRTVSLEYWMELELSMESRIGFNGKVSDEGDFEVIVEGKVRDIKRIIGELNGGR